MSYGTKYDTVADPEDDGVDVVAFADFMRSTKAPSRGPITADVQAGDRLFTQVGCATCHVATIVTARAGTPINGGAFKVPAALGNKIIHPYSDFLLHDIGTGDGIPFLPTAQYAATASQMRTAPLWALRTRNRLMHDGLSFTFQEAIARHAGQAAPVTQSLQQFVGGAEDAGSEIPRFAVIHGVQRTEALELTSADNLPTSFSGENDVQWAFAAFQRVSLFVILTLGCAAAADAARSLNEVLGPSFKPSPEAQPLPDRPRRAHDAAEALLRWNRIAVDASGLDHTPVAAGETRKYGEQLGPGRSSRAMAMVHIAMFDAVNAIIPRYKPYSRLKAPPVLTSMQAAIAQAAHDALVAEYPSQKVPLRRLAR